MTTTLIALAPTSRGGVEIKPNSALAWTFERACEYVDSIGAQPFSRPELSRASGDYVAAGWLIRFYLALGLIERLSERGAKPVYYRVVERALPKRDGTVLAAFEIFERLTGGAA